MYSAGVWEEERSIAFVIVAPERKESEDTYVTQLPIDPLTIYADDGVNDVP